MTKANIMDNSMSKQVDDKILLFCVDNDFETRYITAEFIKKDLVIRFTHFSHYKNKDSIDYICVFDDKNIKSLIKALATTKDNLLNKIKDKFNNFNAYQEIVTFADHNGIKYKVINSNNYDKNEILRYNFGDIYEDNDRLYDSNGNLIIPIFYNPPHDGTMKIYTSEGFLFLLLTYKNGKKNGISKFYFENTKELATIGAYANDKLDGIHQGFYRDGTLKLEEPFDNGVKRGIERSYDKLGRLVNCEEYENNYRNGLAKNFYENGQVKNEATFKNGKQDGYFKEYYETGELKLEVPWKNDHSNGWGISYYKNGQINGKTPWKNSKENGTAEFYYETGELEWSIPYVNGKEDGTVIAYHENGEIGLKKIYKKGKPDGTAYEYYENKKLKGE